LKPSAVATLLTPVASFFRRNGLPLALMRGDWNTTQEQEVVQRKPKTTRIKGRSLYRYEDQWKQALYKVENANINLSLFDPLFEAAYKNIVGR